MESLVPDYLAYGVTRERVGGRMEGIAPSNAYPCADGSSIIIAGNGDAIFQRYMQMIGRPDLATDPGLTRPMRSGGVLGVMNSTPQSASGPSNTTVTTRSSCSTRQASRRGPSTVQPTSAPTSSTRCET